MSEGILPVTGNNSNNNNSNSSNNNSNNNLPRGLMSKSGLPFNPNQRLPSLRSSLSKPSLLFQSSASFNHNQIVNSSSSSSPTKSPITGKRNYESNIGSIECMVNTRRNQPGEVKGFTNGVKQQGGKNGLDSWRGGSTPSSSSTGRCRRQNVKKPRKLIQLESTVFTGAARSPIKKNLDSNKKLKSKQPAISSLPSPVEEQSEDSIEPAYIEGKLYQDDFINQSVDKDDNCDHLPQGWENLSMPMVNDPVTTCKSEHWLTPDPLRDKLILFQLPKMLENQTNTKLGKLRIYESGKVELVNNPSDLIFEVTNVCQSKKINKSTTSSSSTFTSSSSSSSSSSSTITPPASIPNDMDNDEIVRNPNQLNQLDHIEPQLNREVVIYSGRNLISIGKLESDAAIVIPKLFNNI
ncbi:putative uncharacterized protein DDB_G0287457 [Panonychus citri]|uniref:putative uncharacterized protein DDB_G0287457 n=1 Tax=Panonychus citri TaxID=50023 RepID=UPI00230816AA|nr:putative uncharacterized protein DDB_G0287457 [Panonychus citri]